MNFKVWRASSLVGHRMRALAPVWAWEALSFSNMGTRKAAVFPLPVLAMATTSLPSKITGIVWNGKKEKDWVRNIVSLSRKNFLILCFWSGTDLSLDWSWNFITLLNDPSVYRVTETWDYTQCSQGYNYTIFKYNPWTSHDVLTVSSSLAPYPWTESPQTSFSSCFGLWPAPWCQAPHLRDSLRRQGTAAVSSLAVWIKIRRHYASC